MPAQGVFVRSDHLARLIADNAERYPTRPAMRSRHGGVWSAVSYAELGRQVRTMARSLVDAGVQVGDRVGIFSPNRPEWTVADFAILSVGAVSVPIYATSTARQAQLIIDDADVSVLFVGGQEQYDKVVGPDSVTSHVRHVVAFDEETVLTSARSAHAGRFMAAGADAVLDGEVEARLSSGSADDVATLIYTSGTTGNPKGAVLTHANFFHQFRALDERFGIGPGDTSLCFLPLSHAYERAWRRHRRRLRPLRVQRTQPRLRCHRPRLPHSQPPILCGHASSPWWRRRPATPSICWTRVSISKQTSESTR